MGSKYEGDTKNGRPEGKGQYTLPTKTKYIGQLKDGMFHGPGTLHFPDGKKLVGEWDNGTIISGQLVFEDGLRTYIPDELKWSHNTINNCRYHTEIPDGMKPAERLMREVGLPSWKIPKGFFDTGDFLYNPDYRIVYDYNLKFRRRADQDEHNSIMKTFEVKYGIDKSNQEENDSIMNGFKENDEIDEKMTQTNLEDLLDLIKEEN